jgi:hypothetical protein
MNVIPKSFSYNNLDSNELWLNESINIRNFTYTNYSSNVATFETSSNSVNIDLVNAISKGSIIFSNDNLFNVVVNDETAFQLSNSYINCAGISQLNDFVINANIDLNNKNISNCGNIQTNTLKIGSTIVNENNLNIGSNLIDTAVFPSDIFVPNRLLNVKEEAGKFVFGQYDFDIDRLEIIANNSIVQDIHSCNCLVYVNEEGKLKIDSNVTFDMINNIAIANNDGSNGILVTSNGSITKHVNYKLLDLITPSSSNILVHSNLFTNVLETNKISFSNIDISANHIGLNYSINGSNQGIQRQIVSSMKYFPPSQNEIISVDNTEDIEEFREAIYSNQVTLKFKVYNYDTESEVSNILYYDSLDNDLKSIDDPIGNIGDYLTEIFQDGTSYIYFFSIDYKFINKLINPKKIVLYINNNDTAPKSFALSASTDDEDAENVKLLEIVDAYIEPRNPNVFVLNKTDKVFSNFKLLISNNHKTDNENYCKIGGFVIIGDDSVNDQEVYIETDDAIQNLNINSKLSIQQNTNSSKAIFSTYDEPKFSLGLKEYDDFYGLVHFNFDSNSSYIISEENDFKNVMRIFRPCNNENLMGTFVYQSIGAWHYSDDDIKTEYMFTLTENSNVDLTDDVNRLTYTHPLRILSDNRIVVGFEKTFQNFYDSPGVHAKNTVGIYDINSSNYVSLVSSNINSSYNIILPLQIPETAVDVDCALYITSIDSSNVITEWKETNLTGLSDRHVYIGDSTNNYKKAFENSNILQSDRILVGDNLSNVKYSNIDKYNIVVQGNTLQYGKLIISSNSSTDWIDDNLLDNYFLFTDGDIYTSGQIYAKTDISTDSDISYKYNFSNIEQPRNIIKNLSGYTFERNDTPLKRRFTGLIAQEIQKVLPEAVLTKEDGKLRVMYGNLAGLFVEALKDVYDEIDDLKKLVISLKP